MKVEKIIYNSISIESASLIVKMAPKDLLRYAKDEYIDLFFNFTSFVRATTELISTNKVLDANIYSSDCEMLVYESTSKSNFLVERKKLSAARYECDVKGLWYLPSYCIEKLMFGKEKWVRFLISESSDIVVDFEVNHKVSLFYGFCNAEESEYEFSDKGIKFDLSKVYIKCEDVERIVSAHKTGKWPPKKDISSVNFEKGNLHLPANRKEKEEHIFLFIGYLGYLINNPEEYHSIIRNSRGVVSTEKIIAGFLDKMVGTEYDDEVFSNLNRHFSFSVKAFNSVLS